jgi:ribokinase
LTRVVVIGDVMVDVVAALSGPVALGSDSPARIELRGGGSAANAAAWLAVSGCAVTLVGRVGSDTHGAAAVAELREGGVEVLAAVDAERPTGTCVVLVAPGGERTMFPDAGANDGLRPEDLPEARLVDGGHLHVAGYALLREGSRRAALAAIARGRAAGMTVSLDPSSAALLSPAFLALADGAGLLLPNAEEATALTGERDPRRAAAALAARFGEVVVKLGARGALWTDGGDEVQVPAPVLPAAPVLDTTGAGVAFAAGLIAARLAGAAPAEALTAGGELAARAVVTAGARPARAE